MDIIRNGLDLHCIKAQLHDLATFLNGTVCLDKPCARAALFQYCQYARIHV